MDSLTEFWKYEKLVLGSK